MMKTEKPQGEGVLHGGATQYGYTAKPRYFLMCFAKALSISLWRGTGCFCPVAGLW